MSWRDYDMVIILPAMVAVACLMDKAEAWLRAHLQHPFALVLKWRPSRIKALSPRTAFRRKRNA